eukprot:TRINITY_DN33112_c0_g1_i1.p1 TRINITY_DN33112_c0_g1~~TRINITY_DN33112_c0_g1_i1.p1  ORF type:complete len:148 (+),score=24.85 TRINITY_DN33112_c0_g1_i1:47-445(+)
MAEDISDRLNAISAEVGRAFARLGSSQATHAGLLEVLNECTRNLAAGLSRLETRLDTVDGTMGFLDDAGDDIKEKVGKHQGRLDSLDTTVGRGEQDLTHKQGVLELFAGGLDKLTAAVDVTQGYSQWPQRRR